MTIQTPISRSLLEALRDLEREYCLGASVAPTTCWQRATGSMTFLARMENGRTVMVESVDRAVAWFSDNWPVGSRWPRSIKRPAKGRDSDGDTPRERAEP
jgi:hypothetical protein